MDLCSFFAGAPSSSLYTATGSGLLDFSECSSVYDEVKKAAAQEWRESPDLQSQYSKNFKRYLRSRCSDIPHPTQAMKNFAYLKAEVDKRLLVSMKSGVIEIDQLDNRNFLLNLIESHENVDFIRKIYKIKKLTSSDNKKSGLNAKEAKNIQYCLRQGRQLYLSGLRSDQLVKPLVYFYSITSFAYAIIILNSAFRFSLESISNAHGLTHKLPGWLVAFGSDQPNGTFCELFCSFPTDSLSFKGEHGRLDSILMNRISSLESFYKYSYKLPLYAIFSMIPEMDALNDHDKKRVFRAELELDSGGGVPSYRIKLGNGIESVPDDHIKSSFPGYPLQHEYGKTVIEVPLQKIPNLKATFYTDVYGKLWYIASPFPELQLPEICLHFMAIFILSNIMRYQPELWGALLSNEYDPITTTMVRYYLTVFEQKLPHLIMRHTTASYPVIL